MYHANKHVEKRYIAYFGGFIFILEVYAVGKPNGKLLDFFYVLVIKRFNFTVIIV